MTFLIPTDKNMEAKKYGSIKNIFISKQQIINWGKCHWLGFHAFLMLLRRIFTNLNYGQITVGYIGKLLERIIGRSFFYF